MFDECTFDQLRVDGGNWSIVGPPRRRPAPRVVHRAELREANLTGARLRGAKLTKCDLRSAMWSRADVSACDLRGSDIDSLDPNEVMIGGAVVTWEQAVVLARNLRLDVRSGSASHVRFPPDVVGAGVQTWSCSFLTTRPATGRCWAVTPASTAGSSPPSARPASTAGRRAPRSHRSGATSPSSPAPRPRSGPVSARASGAAPTRRPDHPSGTPAGTSPAGHCG